MKCCQSGPTTVTPENRYEGSGLQDWLSSGQTTNIGIAFRNGIGQGVFPLVTMMSLLEAVPKWRGDPDLNATNEDVTVPLIPPN
jgi:hypothetical protein